MTTAAELRKANEDRKAAILLEIEDMRLRVTQARQEVTDAEKALSDARADFGTVRANAIQEIAARNDEIANINRYLGLTASGEPRAKRQKSKFAPDLERIHPNAAQTESDRCSAHTAQ